MLESSWPLGSRYRGCAKTHCMHSHARYSQPHGLRTAAPLMELMSSPSIENLAGKIATKSRLVNRSLLPEGKDEGEGK